MADSTVTALTGASALSGAETFYGLQSGGDVKVTATQIKTWAVGAGSVAVASGKTATVSNSLTLAGTDSTTMTFPSVSASVGFIGIPVNSQSAAYPTVLADAGKCILHPTADDNARTFTIDGSLAYPVGTVIAFANQINTVTLAITTDTGRLAGTGATGDRTLAADGFATAMKLASGKWLWSGVGIT
jgi:hypothetical protein